MNHSLIGDSKLLVVWQALVMLAALVVVLVLVPLLIRRSYKKHGVRVGFAKLALASFCAHTVAVVVYVAVSVVAMLLAFAGHLSQSVELAATLLCVAAGLTFAALSAYGVLRKMVCVQPQSRRRTFCLPAAFVGLALLANLLCFSVSLGRARELVKRSADGMSLHYIILALVSYQAEHKSYPEELRQLDMRSGWDCRSLRMVQDAGSLDPNDVVPDYAYIPGAMRSPARLVAVWESPDFHDGEGGWVLYNDATVEWLSAEQLRQQVQQSLAWVKAHPTTMPDSAPSSQPASATMRRPEATRATVPTPG